MRRNAFAASCLSLLLAYLFFPFLGVAQTTTSIASPAQAAAARHFRDYLQQDWKRWMHEYPEMASDIGFPAESRRWDDHSPAGLASREQHLHESLAALLKIKRA